MEAPCSVLEVMAMLTIRKVNLEVLSESLEKTMSARLVKYMLVRFPHVFGGDAQAARDVVDKATAAAKEYGIKNVEDVAIFADLSVMYGDDFHRDPWASEILTRDTLTPRQKILELRGRVRESGALM